MKTIANISDRAVAVELSRAARKALDQRTRPLLAEMELYFSCFIRKQVHFRDAPADGDQSHVIDGLAVRFRPVMTRACKVSEAHTPAPPLTDFPIARPDAFIPRWLRIDYRGGQWHGEFGYR